MSVPHHSEEEFQRQKRFIEQVLRVAQPRFPQGKAYPRDEGELAFAMAVDTKAKLIRIEFSKPVAWLGFPLREATEMRDMLSSKIQELEKLQTPRKE